MKKMIQELPWPKPQAKTDSNKENVILEMILEQTWPKKNPILTLLQKNPLQSPFENGGKIQS